MNPDAIFRDIDRRMAKALRDYPNANPAQLYEQIRPAIEAHLAHTKDGSLATAHERMGRFKSPMMDMAKSRTERITLEVLGEWHNAGTPIFELELVNEQVFILLQDVAKHLLAPLPAKNLKVRVMPGKKWGLENGGLNEPDVITLTARDRYWSKLAFQFGASLALLYLDGETPDHAQEFIGTENDWLGHTVAVATSLTTMKRMSEAWVKGNGPGLTDQVVYGAHLAQYVREYVDDAALPRGERFEAWFKAAEPRMRGGANEFAPVVAKLLPHIERSPDILAGLRNAARVATLDAIIALIKL